MAKNVRIAYPCFRFLIFGVDAETAKTVHPDDWKPRHLRCSNAGVMMGVLGKALTLARAVYPEDEEPGITVDELLEKYPNGGQVYVFIPAAHKPNAKGEPRVMLKIHRIEVEQAVHLPFLELNYDKNGQLFEEIILTYSKSEITEFIWAEDEFYATSDLKVVLPEVIYAMLVDSFKVSRTMGEDPDKIGPSQFTGSPLVPPPPPADSATHKNRPFGVITGGGKKKSEDPN